MARGASIGAVDTESRCHACRVGIEFLLRGRSMMQYARFRIPMSMLRIWSGAEVELEACCFFTGGEVISSMRRRVRTGFVPELETPHLKAKIFN